MRTGVPAAAALGAILAFGIIVAAARGEVARMTFGDGVLYRYVAENITASPDQVEHDLGGHGTALRYGRIGLPAMLWAASAGKTGAMPYVQPLLMVLSAGAIAAAARMLLAEAGIFGALAPFAAVGLLAALAGGFAEPLALAFALAAFVAARRERWVAAAALLSAAMLTRENAVAVLAGLLVWQLLRRRMRPAGTLALSLVPVVAWHGYVGARFGFLPLADPFLTRQTDSSGPPFVAMWRSLTTSGAQPVTLILIHLALLACALILWRSSDLGASAAASGLLLTSAGPYAWHFIGDGARLGVWLQVLVILALLWARTMRGRATPLAATELVPDVDRR